MINLEDKQRDFDFNQIREALIDIANKGNREHYTLHVVRDVINSFRFNLDHHLKPFVENWIKRNIDDKQKAKVSCLKDFCCRDGIISELARTSKIERWKIYQFISGKREITNEDWGCILDSMNSVEAKYKHREAVKKANKLVGV